MPWAIGDKIDNGGTIIGMGKTKADGLRYLVEYDGGVAVHTNNTLLSINKPKIILGPLWRDAGYDGR
jgi:hypothetical protein